MNNEYQESEGNRRSIKGWVAGLLQLRSEVGHTKPHRTHS